MTYDYLNSNCIGKVDPCRNLNCSESIKQNPRTGRFYITMGHAGFNCKPNNAEGFSTSKWAKRTISYYLNR